MTRGQHVYDRWWPWRLGVIVKCGKASVCVRWSDGDVWRYDSAHLQFLEAAGTEGR